MKIKLYANISANGKVLLSENSAHQVPQAVIGTAIQDIIQAGNLVMGRKSFENFERAFGGMSNLRGVLPKVEFVWLSATKQGTEDYKVVNTPEEAIQYLKEKGFQEVIIGGGTETYNAFLEKDLITEVVFNIVPIITTGGILGTSDELNIKFGLAEHKRLTADVLQLHLTKPRPHDMVV